MNKFKVGDLVKIPRWNCNGVVLVVDVEGSMLPYLVMDEESGDDDWFKEEELTLKSPE